MKVRIDVAEGLPPWGHLRPDQLTSLSPPRVPTDFRLFQGDGEKRRLEVWVEWRAQTLERIKTVLWPEYLPDKQKWEGESAKNMRALTIADLDVMAAIQEDPEGLELARVPRSKLRSADCPIQDELFLLEDSEQFAEAYEHYDRGISEVVSTPTMTELRTQAMRSKVSSVSMQFKSFLQRPRPYQTSLLLGRMEFWSRYAASADSPSMSSGHSLQGVLAVGGILERLLYDETLIGTGDVEKSLVALQQWAVDLGDRRVLAGVHYPSDNLASWLIFLRLADRVYVNREVKRRIWLAITEQSYIYQQICRASENAAHHPYRPILQELKAAAA